MAEFPALPIWTDAFIADTFHLNAAQTGAYFMLLMVAWRTKECGLPDDDKKLASYARMDSRTWTQNKGIVLAFWDKGQDGLLRQKRLSDERGFAEARRDKASHAGVVSALKRKKRHSTSVSTQSQLEVNHPLPKPKPLTTKEDISVKSAFEEWYEIYPKKVAKVAAEKAYRNAKLPDNILDLTRGYALSQNGKEKKYIPNPATWLNGKRWEDAPDGIIRTTNNNLELQKQIMGGL